MMTMTTIKLDDDTAKLLRVMATTNHAQTFGHGVVLLEAARRCDVLRDLTIAVQDYIAELDNPAPDGGICRILRDKLRNLVGAPAAPIKH
jgi:hypothetical protein